MPWTSKTALETCLPYIPIIVKTQEALSLDWVQKLGYKECCECKSDRSDATVQTRAFLRSHSAVAVLNSSLHSPLQNPPIATRPTCFKAATLLSISLPWRCCSLADISSCFQAAELLIPLRTLAIASTPLTCTIGVYTDHSDPGWWLWRLLFYSYYLKIFHF